MTTHTSPTDTTPSSLKTKSLLKNLKIKEPLTKRTYFAMEYFLIANPHLDLNTYFTDLRLLTGKKLITKQDQTTTAIKNFVSYMDNKHLSGNTICNYLSDIRQLHDSFHMELPETSWKQIKKEQKHKGNSFHTTSPTKEQIQRILSNATALEKAYFLLFLTTGKRPDELLNIDLKDLHLDEKPPRINITVENTQTKRRTPYAFTTEEGKEAIQTYLTQRPRFIDRITNSNLPIENKTRFNQSTKLFPICDRTIRERWNILLNKTDLNETSENGGGIKRHKFNHYSLRHYFRTYLGNRDLAEHLMGHTDITNLYNNKQEHEIAQDYLKYSKNLYIYGNQNTDEKIKQELKEKDEQIQRLITSDEMRKQQLADMENKLNRLTTFINRLQIKEEHYTEINKELYRYDEETEAYWPESTNTEQAPPLNKDKKPLTLIARKHVQPDGTIKTYQKRKNNKNNKQ